MGFRIYADWPKPPLPPFFESGNINLHSAWLYWEKATTYLLSEAFASDWSAAIPAAVLKERLPHTLALIAERELQHPAAPQNKIDEICQRFRDFVNICEWYEAETGEPVRIVVDC